MGVIASELGIKKPVSVSINIFGTATISENELLEIIHQAFNFEPRKITEEINYTSLYKLSSYGHVGVYADELPWERLDKIELLKAIANDY